MNKDDKKEYGVYINSMLSKKVVLKITEIGKNIKQNLEKKIKYSIEGKCVAEGFIRPKTVEVVSYSCGLVKDDHIEFQVVYRCLVCNPIKDIEMECMVKNITKAGIHAEVRDNEDNVPITIFVARDHNYTNSMFETVEKDMVIRVKIIGVRFELNDPSITAIAYLLDKKEAEKPMDMPLAKDTELVNVKDEEVKDTNKDINKSPEIPKYWTAWDDENAAIEKMYLDKRRREARELVEQGALPATTLHFIEPKPGDRDFKENPAVVYNEEEIFKQPARKIVVRK